MNASMSAASEFTACVATASTNSRNVSFLATKSVSELTSTTAAVLSSFTTTVQRPSAAILPAFFSAFACPFFLKYSTASSMLPSVSPNAFLQSIIPAPVNSRSSFTIAAVIAIFIFLHLFFLKVRTGNYCLSCFIHTLRVSYRLKYCSYASTASSASSAASVSTSTVP